MSLQQAMLRARCTPYPHSYPQPHAVTMEAVLALEARCADLEAKVDRLMPLIEDQALEPPSLLRRIDSKLIKQAVCRHAKLTEQELLARRRHGRIVRLRQIAIYLAKELTFLSLPQIGRLFGKLDHTTVIHAVRKTEERCRQDKDFCFEVVGLRLELEAMVA